MKRVMISARCYSTSHGLDGNKVDFLIIHHVTVEIKEASMTQTEVVRYFIRDINSSQLSSTQMVPI